MSQLRGLQNNISNYAYYTKSVSIPISTQRTAKNGVDLSFAFSGIHIYCLIACGDWRPFTLIAAVAIVGVPIALIIESFQRNPMTTKIVGYTYHSTCLICGFHWDWQEGQDKPEVHVRPDLIAKGEQRLREEAQQAEIANRVAQDILNRKP